MQISMPPARPPAGIERPGLGTPWPGGPSRRRRHRAAPPPRGPSPARTLPRRGPLRDSAHAPTWWSPPGTSERLPGRACAWARGPGRAPAPPPLRKLGGAWASPAHPEARTDRRFRVGVRSGPPARIAFPGCVSLAFPDPGAAAVRARGARGSRGAAMASRRRGARRRPRVRASAAGLSGGGGAGGCRDGDRFWFWRRGGHVSSRAPPCVV